MQRDQFSTMLQAPHPVLPEQREALLELTRNYPWFQAAHVLLAKLDHDHRHIQYHTHLKRAAVYAPDREVLYQMLMKPQLQATVEAFDAACEVVEAEEAVTIAQPPGGTIDAVEPPDHPAEAAPIALNEEVLSVVLPEVPETAAVVQETMEAEPAAELELEAPDDTPLLPLELVREDEQPTLPIKRAADFDDLQREILLEAITSSIEREVSESYGEQAPVPAAEPAPQAAPPAENLSAYTRWLLQRSASGAPKVDATPVSPPDEPIDLKAKQRNIIDTFIQNDPKISKGKVEMFSTENLARMSLVEDERFVTETMAAIYARQGHVRKAIKAYQLLALNYPEKSVYFANQIKKLQERR
jgi:hypothetical protein